VEQVVQQVEKHFGRLTVQKLMRVRNSLGHTAIHLALAAGTLLNWPTFTFAPSRSERVPRFVWRGGGVAVLWSAIDAQQGGGAAAEQAVEEAHTVAHRWLAPTLLYVPKTTGVSVQLNNRFEPWQQYQTSEAQ